MSICSRVFVLAALTGLAGCAPYIGTCGWIVPEVGEALEVVDVRQPIGGECNCINCGAPGRFLIERGGYTLEFWNGDRWYPQLYVRARSSSGAILTLTSDPPELLRIAPHVPPTDTYGFEYFLRGEAKDGTPLPKSLSISVIDRNDVVLGVEVVGLRVESRKDLSIEYL